MRIITVNGRIAADVSRQVSKQGTEFISFSIANNEYGDPKDSQGKPITEWFRVTSFLPQHVNLAQHLKKGKPITVIGKYSNRLYKNQTTGLYNISNDVIAEGIYFEVGSERSNSGAAATPKGESESVQTVKDAVDEIPQVTSAKKPKAKVAVVEAPVVTDDDDDLPF